MNIVILALAIVSALWMVFAYHHDAFRRKKPRYKRNEVPKERRMQE